MPPKNVEDFVRAFGLDLIALKNYRELSKARTQDYDQPLRKGASEKIFRVIKIPKTGLLEIGLSR